LKHLLILGEKMGLSREELSDLTKNSADPDGTGPYINRHENVGLTDSELIAMIVGRNATGKPTYKLRMEYAQRLKQRDL
jgi:hypothetical protein